MAKSTKSRKGMRKSFFDVKAPLTSTKVSLYGYSAEDLAGQVVRLDLTKSLRGKSLELQLKVKLDGEELVGVPVKSRLSQGYVRRMVRKGTDYVEDSFVAECRDFKVVVKPFMITRNKVSRSVRRALRDLAKKTLEGYIKSRTAEEIFGELMSNKLQKSLSLKLKKIYPLALCEIRVFEVLGEKDKEEVEDSEEEAKEE